MVQRLNKIVGVAAAFSILAAVRAYAHGVSEADKAAMVSGGLPDYVELGARHMVTGYDHLLFLFGVMFFLTRFGEIVKFITAFTLGHCVTLVGATYLEIQANYFLIDAVIALTVVYKGFDNLDGFRKYLDVKAPNLLGAVFVFGLIHGFGLSTRLQQLPLPEEGFLLRILAFNLGVELGQIAALAVMLTALASWRQTDGFKKFSGAANAGLIAAGGLLFLMQLHGYSHTEHPEEFGFPTETHRHEHEHVLAPSADPNAIESREQSAAPASGYHVHADGQRHANHGADAAGAVPEPNTEFEHSHPHTHEPGYVHPPVDLAGASPVASPDIHDHPHTHTDGHVHVH